MLFCEVDPVLQKVELLYLHSLKHTGFRSTGMAVTLAFGRLGAILGQLTFGYLLDVNCAVPIIIVAALMISGGLTGLLVPNTTGIALD